MKLLIVGDIHIKGKKNNRMDDYYKSIMKKLIFIYKISENYDAIVLTGDIFDSYNVSYSVIYNVNKLFDMFKVPVYGIIGNHDVPNGKIDKLKYSALGLIRNIKIIGLDAINIGDNIWLEGVKDVYAIDDDISCYDFKSEVSGLKIKVVHGAMIGLGETFFGKYTNIDKIVNTTADIVISGHVHGNFKWDYIKDKLFIRAGSIARTSSSDKRDDIYIGVLDTDTRKIEKIKILDVLPYKEIFNIKEKEQKDMIFIDNIKSNRVEDIMDLSIIMEQYLDNRLYKKFKELWDSVL